MTLCMSPYSVNNCSTGMISTCEYLNVRLQCVQCQAKTVCPHSTQAVLYFWQPISRPAETTFSQIRCGKNDEIRLCLLCCGGCREERSLLYILKISDIVFRHWSFGGPPPIFWHCPVVPGGPWGPHWRPLNEWTLGDEFVISLLICLFVVY